MLIEDFLREHPDFVLIDRRTSWKEWACGDVRLRRLLDDYVQKTEDENVELYVRRDLIMNGKSEVDDILLKSSNVSPVHG